VRALKAHPENPKAHDLGLLRSSVERFGFVEPIVVDERTGYLISGHGRAELLRAQADAGAPLPDGVVVRDGEWLAPVVGWHSRDDAEARAALIALNRVGERGGWDPALLAATLQLVQADDLLRFAGFSEGELLKIVAKQNHSTASLLSRSDVTLGEPTHHTDVGDCWRLAGRNSLSHLLVVGDVATGWPTWAPLLSEGALFVPYPGPYAALSVAAERQPLVLVQPEPYIAAHLLDKTAAILGEEALERVSGAA
jgi:hypothetical protein